MTEKPTYPKSTCCIIGCSSWSRRYPGEWICGRHWKSVRRSRRLALRKLWRRLAAHYETLDNGGPIRVDAGSPFHRDRRSERRIWRAAKREATLKAAGL